MYILYYILYIYYIIILCIVYYIILYIQCEIIKAICPLSYYYNGFAAPHTITAVPLQFAGTNKQNSNQQTKQGV